MKVMDLNKTIPQVRFPNFNEPWKKVSLGECTIKISEKNINNILYPIYSINNQQGFIPQGDQFEGLNSNERGYDISMYKIIHAQTFAYNPARINVGSIGYSGSLDNIIISSLYVCFKTTDKIYDPFLFIYLKSKKFLKEVKRNVEGGVRDYLFYNNFSQIKTYLPSIEEQRKIASLIQILDSKILNITEKKKLYIDYKNEVFKQIIKQEIRFKNSDGNFFPKWKKRELNDFLIESKIKGSNGLLAKKITVKLWGKGVLEKEEKNEGSEQTQYYVRRAGQFIYSKLDFLNCAFGIIPKELDGYESTVDLPCFDISDELNSKFLLEYVKMTKFYKKLGESADGSRKAKRIHASTFLSFKIDYPIIEEQEKISRILETFDFKIEKIIEELEAVKSFRNGLIQKIFV